MLCVAFYTLLVILILLVLVPFFIFFRVKSERLARIYPPRNCARNRYRRHIYHTGVLLHYDEEADVWQRRLCFGDTRDRQGNIFTISDNPPASTLANRYADFFYLEPNSDEASRIRVQLEKDDKDLPSYDEVMRLSTATALESSDVSATLSRPPNSSSLPPIHGPAPPYSEIAPNSAPSAATGGAVTAANTSVVAEVTPPANTRTFGAASTSRAAAGIFTPIATIVEMPEPPLESRTSSV